MRVALLTNFVPPYRIPVFRALRDRVDALRIFVSTAMESNRQWTPDWSDLDVVVQKTLTLRRKWRHERFSEDYELHVPYDTVAQLRRFRPDVILTAEFGARTIQAMAYGGLTDTPVFVWATLTDVLEPSRGQARQLVRRVIVNGARGVIVNGQAGARYIRSLGYDRIHIIPQAVDAQRFLELPISRDNPHRMIFVGHVSKLKGFDLLFEAIQRLHAADLIVVGDGPLKEELQRRKLPPNIKVEWIGSVPYDELAALYARAGILVFPTQGDEWGLVVNEAMASALAVLGSEYSQAVEELVVEGQNGWRFRPDSVDVMRDQMQRALQTPVEKLNAFRDAARQTAASLTHTQTAARIEEVLASC